MRDELSPAQESKILKEAAKILMDRLAEDRPTNLEEKNTVTVTGFGTFKCYLRKGRSCVNPFTKKKIEVPEKLAVSFKPSPAFLKRLND